MLKQVWIESSVFGGLFLGLLLSVGDRLEPDGPLLAVLGAALVAFMVRGGLGSLRWRWLASGVAGFAALCALHTIGLSGEPPPPSGDMPDLNAFWPVTAFMAGVPLGMATQALTWLAMVWVVRYGAEGPPGSP